MASAVAAAAALTACGGATGPPAADRPNVLFIPVDDLRPELGTYDRDYVKSPNIDRLAAGGIVFGRAYTQSALCNPSRASLLTGLRPDTIRVWDLQTDFRTTSPDAVTLPQHFRNNGYAAVGIGKTFHNTLPDAASWDEDAHLDGFPFDPDAVYFSDENLVIQEARRQQITKEGRSSASIDRFGQWYLKAQATEGPDVPDNRYYDGAQTDWAIDRLAALKAAGRPFFLAVGYYRPHLPFNAPKKYWDMYDRQRIPLAENPFVPKGAPLMALNTLRELRGYSDFKDAPSPIDGTLNQEQSRLLRHGYLASVSYIDAQIGRLLEALDRLDLARNTIVVLWGDHGWKLGEHNSWAKMTNYEIDTRAPLIVRAPGRVTSGVVTNRLVEFVDIYPTVAELAGLPVPPALEGASLVPLMATPDRPWKQAVFSQFLRDGTWMAPDGVPYMGYAIRTESHRYVEWRRWPGGELAAVELYDERVDPQENENLAARPEHAALLRELAAALEKARKDPRAFNPPAPRSTS
ncbi:MAG: sulfatase [Vicinamibacterales bacterium]